MKSKAKLRIWTILLTNCLEKYDSNQQFRAHVSPLHTQRQHSPCLRLRISPRNLGVRALFSALYLHFEPPLQPLLKAIMKEGNQSILTKV